MARADSGTTKRNAPESEWDPAFRQRVDEFVRSRGEVGDGEQVSRSDFIELLDPSGNSVGTDGQHAEDEVDVFNPQPGTWTLLTCMFLPDSAGPHNYTGAVTIKTKCRAASPCPTPPKRKKK